jgi:hypothetical protein
MLPEFDPERPEPAAVPAAPGSAAAAEAAAADAEYLASLLANSAKLQLLDGMLGQLRAQGKQVMVLAHSPRVSEAATAAAGAAGVVWVCLWADSVLARCTCASLLHVYVLSRC